MYSMKEGGHFLVTLWLVFIYLLNADLHCFFDRKTLQLF